MADPATIGQGGIVGCIVAVVTAVAYRFISNYRKPADDGDGDGSGGGGNDRVADLKARVAQLEHDLDEEREGRQRDRRDFDERIDRLRRDYDERLSKLQDRLYEAISHGNPGVT